VLTPAVDNLVAQLARLPGVGQRTAQRLAFHLLRVPAQDALALADAIREVKERIGFCVDCFNLAEDERCRICLDARRDPLADLRRRGALRHRLAGAHRRVPRALPRARRGALTDRRDRPRGPAHRPSS